MTVRPIVNICVPVYLVDWDTQRVLCELLQSINEQDYPQDRIRVKLSVQNCKNVSDMQDIMDGIMSFRPQSITNPEGVDGPAKNTNSAMSMAEHPGYIKLMNQDDFLDNPTTLSQMVETLEGSDAKWLVNACIHTDGKGEARERVHQPFWPGEKGMVEGVNRFGCPSVVMFDTSLSMQCDPVIEYAMDCDMWIQLYQDGGAPVIRNVPDVVIRMWDAQLTNQLNTAAALERDKIYMRKKYGYQ